MGKTLNIFQHFDCLNYSFGGIGLFDARRAIMALELMREKGLLEEGLTISKSSKLKPRELMPFHSSEYIHMVEHCCLTGEEAHEFGLNTPVMRLNPLLFESCLSVVSATVSAALYTMEKNAPSFTPYGGLHHAHRDMVESFCIFNDLAVAAGRLHLKHGKRVSILDLDLHRGDGTEQILAKYSDIQTISIHGGNRNQTSKNPEINAINYMILNHSGDTEYLEILNQALSDIADFRPDILIVQCGVDTYCGDAMKSMNLTMEGFKEIYSRLNIFGESLVDNRMVYTGGGGYGYRFAAPRAWTVLAATILGVELDNKLSDDWIQDIGNAVESGLERENMPQSLKDKLLVELLAEIPKTLME